MVDLKQRHANSPSYKISENKLLRERALHYPTVRMRISHHMSICHGLVVVLTRAAGSAYVHNRRLAVSVVSYPSKNEPYLVNFRNKLFAQSYPPVVLAIRRMQVIS